MKRILGLILFPLLGLAMLGVAALWSGREIRLRLAGEESDGRLVGMQLARVSGTDLIDGIGTRLVLDLADQSQVDVEFYDYQFIRGTSQRAGESQRSELTAKDLNAGGPVRENVIKVIHDVMDKDASFVRWALQRESRRPEDKHRVVRITKSETIHGYIGLNFKPKNISYQESKVLLNDAQGQPVSRESATIHAVFDFTNPKKVSDNKGDSMMSYEYLRKGEKIEPHAKDFYLNAEAYTTSFTPIFAFDAGGKPQAAISHIGRRGGATLALKIFGSCKVYYDKNNPSDAFLMANPQRGEAGFLAWFSLYCEGLFGQWGSGTLMVLIACFYLGTGALVLSLRFFPSKHLEDQAATES